MELVWGLFAKPLVGGGFRPMLCLLVLCGRIFRPWGFPLDSQGPALRRAALLPLRLVRCRRRSALSFWCFAKAHSPVLRMANWGGIRCVIKSLPVIMASVSLLQLFQFPFAAFSFLPGRPSQHGRTVSWLQNIKMKAQNTSPSPTPQPKWKERARKIAGWLLRVLVEKLLE